MRYYVEVKDGEVISTSPIEYLGDLPAVEGAVDITGLDPMPVAYVVPSTQVDPNPIDGVDKYPALVHSWTYVDGVFTAPAGYEHTVSADELRVERDKLLCSSDFTQLPDVFSDTDRAAWATYRQSLRDLLDGYTPVANPAYPAKP